MFLIVLYFQIMRGYSPLQTGVRVLPVAVSLAVSSGLGTVLAVRIGNKIVVAAGLLLVGAGYAWVASAPDPTHVVRADRAANDPARHRNGSEHGTGHRSHPRRRPTRTGRHRISSQRRHPTYWRTLGVAILGSVYASLYRSKLDSTAVPQAVINVAKGSFGASRAAAAQLPAPSGRVLIEHANRGFLDGLHASCAVAAAVCLVGAVIVVAFLPAFPNEPNDQNSTARTAEPVRFSAAQDSPASVLLQVTPDGLGRRHFPGAGSRWSGLAWQRRMQLTPSPSRSGFRRLRLRSGTV